MVELDHNILKELLELLIPIMEEEDNRRPFLILALGNEIPVLQHINWKGSAITFIPHMIVKLVDYGEVTDGTQALWILLKYLRAHVGTDLKQRIDNLRPLIDLPSSTFKDPSQEHFQMLPNNAVEIEKLKETLNKRKLHLAELEISIQSTGGMIICPEDSLLELLNLRREISNLEKEIENLDKLSLTETSLKKEKYGIPESIPYIDRPEERQFIENALKSSENWVRYIVIKGMGGTGKTVLAMEAARKVEGLFKKVIWASANDSPIDLAAALDIVLRAIGYRSDQLTISQKQAKVRELFCEAPYLLVVDSFERIGDKQVDKFLAENIFYPSKVLITTRHIWPRASSSITLEGLTQKQTKQMLQEIGTIQGIKGFGNNDILKIHNITAGLPYAIRLIIGQISQGLPLELVVRNLINLDKSNPHNSNVEESWVNSMFENLFGNSWQALSEDARHILMSMTFFAAPAAEEAIQVISNAGKERFNSEIENLIKMSLLLPHRDRMGGDELRFTLHPLTRSFSSRQMNSNILLKKGIYASAVDYFTGLMEQLGRPGIDSTNYDKLEQDLSNCLAAFDWCRNQRDIENILKIVEYLNHFLFERGFWDTRIQICSSASDLEYDSLSKKDYEADWRLAFWAGWVCSRQNNYEEAKKWLEKAQDNLDKISDRNVFKVLYKAKILQLHALIKHGEAVEAYKLSISKFDTDNDAETLFKQANQYHNTARQLLEAYIKDDGPRWTFETPDYAIALVDSNQGDLFVDMGHWKNTISFQSESRQHFEVAQDLYLQVLENAQKSQWSNKDALIAFSAANLGHVEIWLEEKPLEEIRRRFDVALEAARSINRDHTIAWCYRGYGLLEQRSAQNEISSIKTKRNKLTDAQNWLKQALDIFERIGRRERVAETKESLREVEAVIEQLMD